MRRAEQFGRAPRRVARSMLCDVEAPDYDEARAFMSPRRVMETALRCEEKAHAFFVSALGDIGDPAVPSPLEELRDEEVDHQDLAGHELAKRASRRKPLRRHGRALGLAGTPPYPDTACPGAPARYCVPVRRPSDLFASLLVLAACSSGPTGPAQPAALPVRVTAVERRDVPVAVRAIGNVEAFQTVTLRSQVEGQLAEVRFKEGDEVGVGDLLFVIDTGPFQAALDQAKANLVKVDAEAANAAVQARRMSELSTSGIVSRDEWDRSRTDAASAAASVEAAKAALENAKLQLGFCYIVSRLDGRIGRLLVNQGNLVKANDTQLATINQMKPIYVSFTVPEKDLPAIRQWRAEHPLATHVAFPSVGGEPIPGELSFIDNRVDTTTGTVLLKAVFPNADETLWPGQFVNVTLTLTTEHDAVVVPAPTVQTGQDGTYVFVVKPDSTVDYRPVKIARTEGQDAVVSSGLEPGERVVTTGFIRLAPGIKVTVEDAAPAAERIGDAR